MVPKQHQRLAYVVCGHLRQLALFAMGVMGLWPLVLQVALVPESVFGDGHGDRYEHLSYFAMENAHYQVLSPFKVDCSDLQATLFPGNPAPTPTKDLIRAVSEASFKTTRSLVVNQTTATNAVKLSVATDILGLATDKSVCFGGVDDEGSVQIEALLSRVDAVAFGLDASCVQDSATHFRLRLQSTEFFNPDTMGELNPTRVGGAMFIVSLVDQQLAAVVSSCHAATRDVRYKATLAKPEYIRLVSVYSPQLLVSDSCNAFVLYGGTRDAFGCAYASVGASGAVATIDSSSAAFAFPAPWRMIQCTVVGECSSLLFTQLWLSEWTVETAASGQVLRHNFINHKVNEVTVDSTFSLRLIISLQILALVITAYLTSVRGWYLIRSAVVSPWSRVVNATTSCTIAKVVRSSYNFILAAQLVLGIIQWRRQLTIDVLVGADINQTSLRAVGFGTLAIVMAINILFARAGDLKMQEMEPGFAHVLGFLASVVIYVAVTVSASTGASALELLASGMHSVPSTDVTKYSGCRGSLVCAVQVSLSGYVLVLAIIIVVASLTGFFMHKGLQFMTRQRQFTSLSSTREQGTNSFTRYLDDRSQSLSLYDPSTEIYVEGPGNHDIVSTRSQLEACGFVTADSMLFRYRDLPAFLVARVLPLHILNWFNLTVTVYELHDTGDVVSGLPVMYVADQIVHAHWSKLKGPQLRWSQAYYGGDQREQKFTSSAIRVIKPKRSASKNAVLAEN